MTTNAGQLKRQLGVNDAVIIGAGSMIGAGVFATWAPAAEVAAAGRVGCRCHSDRPRANDRTPQRYSRVGRCRAALLRTDEHLDANPRC